MKFINKSFCLFLTATLISLPGHAWNAMGHRLVAQIALDNMTPKAKKIFSHYNHQLDKTFRAQSLVNAAPWMDSLHYMNNQWLKSYHYIDTPFSSDGTKGKKPPKTNAVWAIQSAKKNIKNIHASSFDKGFSARVLLHVVGDLHQPLHAVSQYSKAHPKGDAGGNLFLLPKNAVGNNLHAYWDAGGGFLSQKHAVSTNELQAKAAQIEKNWPCRKLKNAADLNPEHWSRESYQLAKTKVYSIKKGTKPNKSYQNMVQTTSQKQIALAGCRLAGTLNKLAAHS